MVYKGVGFVPSAVDSASSHLGKVSREIQKAKEAAGVAKVNWIPSEFESIADKILLMQMMKHLVEPDRLMEWIRKLSLRVDLHQRPEQQTSS